MALSARPFSSCKSLAKFPVSRRNGGRKSAAVENVLGWVKRPQPQPQRIAFTFIGENWNHHSRESSYTTKHFLSSSKFAYTSVECCFTWKIHLNGRRKIGEGKIYIITTLNYLLFHYVFGARSRCSYFLISTIGSEVGSLLLVAPIILNLMLIVLSSRMGRSAKEKDLREKKKASILSDSSLK